MAALITPDTSGGALAPTNLSGFRALIPTAARALPAPRAHPFARATATFLRDSAERADERVIHGTSAEGDARGGCFTLKRLKARR
jgi:hypothetical protein